MLGMMGFPEGARGNRQIFYGRQRVSGAAGGNGFGSWIKPPGCTMMQIFCLGAGAGGGRGAAGASGSSRSGGGGGGSGGLSVFVGAAIFLPDILYVLPGLGGLGSSTGDGNDGEQSYVTLIPSNADARSRLMISSASVSVRGLQGSGTVAGTGGAGATIALLHVDFGPWLIYGHANLVGGRPGSAGGASVASGTAGVAAVALDTSPFCGGAGGAGTGSGNSTAAGGGITGVTNMLNSIVGGVAGGGNGSDGWRLLNGFRITGGAGGGSNDGAVGGAGGNGGWGCGGGGGGGGNTSGKGGDGGPGLVIIDSW